jgi:UDP-N-acetylmuramoyl-tripeptide--D-alanyl-D-alanine ligase
VGAHGNRSIMADFIAAEILSATGGRLAAGRANAACSGVSTDTRALVPGQCFVALRGERFDGHDFAAAALQSGAAGAIVSRLSDGILPAPDRAFVIVVEDTLKALGDLARLHRGRFDVPVIGVTGSTGKTTTKDMIAAILARRGPVAATPENFNNEIGVPLALLSMAPDHTAAVIEMAMRGPGEVAYLASLARPTVAVITNIGLSHLERLGSPDAIADAKGELLDAVGAGVSVLNADDAYFERLSRRARGRVVSFGVSEAADFRGAEIAVEPGRTRFRLICPTGETEVLLAAPGRHQALNSLAAAAAAIESGATLGDVAEALAAFSAAHGRAEVLTSKGGFRILNDCYNASPASVEVALGLLADAEGRHKIAILGDMLELGPTAPELHRSVGEEAGRIGLEMLIAVGDLSRFTAEGARAAGARTVVRWTTSSDQAATWALDALEPGDVVLVKASRAMAFEEITRRLMDG